MIALAGMLLLLAIGVLASSNWRHIRFRVVGSAFALQALIAIFALYIPMGKDVLGAVALGVGSIVTYADEGISFLFGPLGNDSSGFIFAFRVLPVIVFVSSLIAVLYYLKIMQWIVLLIGGGLQKIIGARPVESLSAAANIFVGMVEAPLVVRPYLASLSHSQLFSVMAVGLSSVSGAILVGYASLGINLEYLLAAAFMAAPGGLLQAKLLMPESPDEREEPIKALDATGFDPKNKPANVIEAAADGAMSGLKIAVSVGALLLAFVALLALLNDLFGGIGSLLGFEDLSLELVLGVVLSPLMYLMGIPWHEAAAAGNLLGQKTILNEFIAYVQLAQIQDTLSAHSVAVITFALCGFANFPALAIIFGGLGAMLPDRKSEIARLGLKAILAGTLSNLMSAAMASFLLSL
ncbi:nucleoside permease [Iodidimonas nitroreducens]|uniref:Nucleoside permease n=1 Tax=Iodidimonas nitroreducens TaxID=1236968 RepID=A0A5A7NAW5_9PROT|nr:nucleoside transporter C-terminal domain-containing protein [Iodidimonas nitroreducens]GAK33393.1 putative transporter [alpha proteobacterium Q-1]GER04630.1 nucleoside permease [Iodidimonas nitroreducens]